VELRADDARVRAEAVVLALAPVMVARLRVSPTLPARPTGCCSVCPWAP